MRRRANRRLIKMAHAQQMDSWPGTPDCGCRHLCNRGNWYFLGNPSHDWGRFGGSGGLGSDKGVRRITHNGRSNPGYESMNSHTQRQAGTQVPRRLADGALGGCGGSGNRGSHSSARPSTEYTGTDYGSMFETHGSGHVQPSFVKASRMSTLVPTLPTDIVHSGDTVVSSQGNPCHVWDKR